MKEYEYTIKVKDLKPFIDFCKKNNYKLISVEKQNRKVYENNSNSKIIARITSSEVNGEIKNIFDIKNVGEKSENLKISNESLPLEITPENKSIIESMLSVLEFNLAADNKRIRYVYQKDDITFEIDDYTSPKAHVVAIEGKKESVDAVYEEILGLDK